MCLCVVPQWAGYSHDYRRQCRALLAAGAWAQAHEVLCGRIAPVLLLRQSAWPELQELLQQLQGHAAQIPDWGTGGGLYLQYLAARDEPTDAAAAVALLQSASEAAAAAAGAKGDMALCKSVGLGMMVEDAVAMLAKAGQRQQRLGLDAPAVVSSVRGHVINRVAGELGRLVAVQSH